MAKKTKRVSVGNVIYANFGAPKDTPESAQPTRVHQEDAQTIGSFVNSLITQLTDSRRVARGRTYARQGSVLSMQAQRGAISAQVIGSQNIPFTVHIRFPQRHAQDRARISEIMQERPRKTSRLPREILELMLCRDDENMALSCDCPDKSYCCKHIIAVLHTITQTWETDLKRFLEFREVSIVEQSTPKKTDTPEVNDSFWSGHELPELPQPKSAPALNDSDLSLLHKAMRMLSYTSIDELRAVADIEDMYDFLVHDVED
ncbi:hypothetical protein EML15_07515 [Corynebacterium sp. sy017]|uniref:SWIM zinc finger family protein n=1 Tax=unclassified Corynebacterium TaxID=2624378 RepID=UPI0011854241|nr:MULTISPECIES: SWIM zinc finger family protein [unclassified Corynebacterium]MBP3088991.1 hypothetical protein [Corynebacterium sp. sy017]TSD91313.1 hypothetical protein ELY17_07525 [Corynebacterium sp. SY003]